MVYTFLCPNCESKVELIMSMADYDPVQHCTRCKGPMRRDFSDARVGKGRKQYRRPIISDSLAVSIDQIEEHKRLFPDVQITDEGQPVLDTYEKHEAYRKARNVEKLPGKPVKTGRVYKRSTELRTRGLVSTQDRWIKSLVSSPTSRREP